MPIGFIWQTFLETPLINFMVLLTVLSFGSFGIAILLFTVISRVITFPLTLRTLRAARSMQELAPRLEEIKRKHSDPRRRNEETMKLYRESGVNPLGCLGPQLVQFPIFIALYQVIRITLGGTPESVLHLSTRLYDVDLIQRAIPLDTHFLLIDLGETGNIPLTLIVFASMWLQQRISAGRSQARAGSQQAEFNRTLQFMLPIMFGWFSFFVPAGVSLYWASSTIIGVVLQWRFVGPGDFTWGSLVPAPIRGPLGIEVPERAVATSAALRRRTADGGTAEDTSDTDDTDAEEPNGSGGTKRQDGRRRRRKGSGTTGTQSRSSRRRRHSRR